MPSQLRKKAGGNLNSKGFFNTQANIQENKRIQDKRGDNQRKEGQKRRI